MKTFLTCIVILSALLFCYAIGCFATEDVTGPVLTGFSFSPSTVNTSSGAQTITFNMTITDALSGFEHGKKVEGLRSIQFSAEIDSLPSVVMRRWIA